MSFLFHHQMKCNYEWLIDPFSVFPDTAHFENKLKSFYIFLHIQDCLNPKPIYWIEDLAEEECITEHICEHEHQGLLQGRKVCMNLKMPFECSQTTLIVYVVLLCFYSLKSDGIYCPCVPQILLMFWKFLLWCKF